MPDDRQIQDVSEPNYESPFALRHIPEPSEEGFVLAGHLHPAIELRGKGCQIINVPCFRFGEHIGVLPAFGAFTDVSVVRPREGDQIIGIADQRLFRLSP